MNKNAQTLKAGAVVHVPAESLLQIDTNADGGVAWVTTTPGLTATTADELGFDDNSFDAAMAIATVHHWADPIAGLGQLRRVARRVVVFTYDLVGLSQFWLTRDYLPELPDLLRGHPSLSDQAETISARIEPMLIPWVCVDGFFEAYWRRPEVYLDESVRRGISTWARRGPEVERRAVRRLREDLVSGRWTERNHDLVNLDAADLGLQLLIA